MTCGLTDFELIIGLIFAVVHSEVKFLRTIQGSAIRRGWENLLFALA